MDRKSRRIGAVLFYTRRIARCTFYLSLGTLTSLFVLGCEKQRGRDPPAPPALTGTVIQTFASGSSYGDKVGQSAHYENTAVMGESTPLPSDGRVPGVSLDFENHSGLNASLLEESHP